jgi:DinB superfamily
MRWGGIEMMESAMLATSLRAAHGALQMNLDGVTDADALQAPAPGGNCINWIAGHILVSRDAMHKFLDLEPAWTQTLGEGLDYRRGSRSFSPDRSVPLSSIVAGLVRSQELLLGALKQAPPETFPRRASETRTVGEQLAFLAFHEGYHVGQIGLLRRLSGRSGAIT